MGKKRNQARDSKRVPAREQTGAFHTPFAGLTDLRRQLPVGPDHTQPAVEKSPGIEDGDNLADAGKLVVQSERAGRGGKTVTRIKGLPTVLLPELRQRMAPDLGCGVTVEGDDLLLLGSLAERAAAWLKRKGATKVVQAGRSGSGGPAKNRPPRAAPSQGLERAPGVGTERGLIVPGLTVDVVLKADQATGACVRGVVKDVLTRSATHPHGIKVRLLDGRVGRVKRVLMDP